MNQLFNQMNNMGGFMQKLQQLKSMGGNPQEIVQNMLNSGRVSQEQYNTAVQQAQQLQRMFSGH